MKILSFFEFCRTALNYTIYDQTRKDIYKTRIEVALTKRVYFIYSTMYSIATFNVSIYQVSH